MRDAAPGPGAISGRVAVGAAVAVPLVLGALLLFPTPGLHGGADLLPHLGLIQQMAGSPGLRSVYAPAYHVLGALLAPVVGLARYPEAFALVGLALFLAGFRAFQRSAGLPDASTVLFASSPYLAALVWCIPKVEAAGYGLALFGMASLLHGRLARSAVLLVTTFLFHTAAGLLFGLAGGVLCLVRRDLRGLVALALGAAAAAPLFAAHLAAGCSLAEAFLFSRADYLRSETGFGLRMADVVLLLANPLLLVLAALGAGETWRRHRPVAVMGAVLIGVYLNELWLLPFGRSTTLNLLRGLSVLAIPVAVSAGVALTTRPRFAPWMIGACLVWMLGTTLWVMPRACFVRPVQLDQLEDLSIDRCTFRWSAPALRRAATPVRSATGN